VDVNDRSGLDDSEPPPALDLTPRHGLDDVDAIRRELGKGKKRWITVAGVLIVFAFGFLVVQFLQDATVFFRNVDQAVAERDELGDRRFRIQGRVIPDSVEVIDDVVTFEILHGCATAAVRHLTDPAELFDNPWIPVVLDGSWKPQTVKLVGGTDDYVFESDRMLINHTNEYSSNNAEQVESNLPDDFLVGCDLTRNDVGLD